MLSLFERFTKPFPERELEQPPSGLFAFCMYHSRGMKLPLVGMSILTALLAVSEVFLFGFMGQLVDWLSTKTPDTFLEEEGLTLMIIGFAVLICMPVLALLQTVLVHQTLLGNYPMAIRWTSHKYLLGQSIGFYQNDFAGRIATKVMQTALSVREAVMKLLDVLVYVAVYFLSMLALIASADIRLALIILIWFGIYVTVQFYFVPKLKKVSTEQADARSSMTGRVVDSYTNINTVKLFAHTQQESVYARDSMKGFLSTVYKQMRLVSGLDFFVDLNNYLLVSAITGTSIWLWLHDDISVGAIAIAISLALRFNGMSQWIMWEISALFENIGAVADGVETLAKPIDVVDKPQAPNLNVNAGGIQFKDVQFHYGKGSGVIDSLNLDIKPGEKIGLVGRSGAGKSTLVNLLLRFHDVESGEILIDGQNISEVKQESLRAQVGMVSQDTSLLHRSVRDNILYGKPHATELELQGAIDKAEAAIFIDTLEDPQGRKGLDAQVGERGVKLSGGQRQRIAISRVLLKDAPILVLDEATSALDSEVEAAIQTSLYKLMEGKTVIAIAHRLSTIAALDRLIVLDKGQIVEQGTHQELVAKGGIYSQLWDHQTGGFLGH